MRFRSESVLDLSSRSLHRPNQDYIRLRLFSDPVPAGNSDYDVAKAKELINGCDLSIQEMIEVAWASASTRDLLIPFEVESH